MAETTNAPRNPTTTAAPIRRWGLRLLLAAVLLPLVGLGLWTAFALGFSYADGERAGVVQKFSKRGWICKTWEGELAMINFPGAMQSTFTFSVRDDRVAEKINSLIGQRVTLVYEQHRFVPTSCFGETEYFVSDIKPLPPANIGTVSQ